MDSVDLGHARSCAILIPGMPKNRKKDVTIYYLWDKMKLIFEIENREPENLLMFVKVLTIK